MLRIDQLLHQRYRVIRQLGRGGMGAVYEALDERFGGPIALKEIVFPSSNEQQKEIVARAFDREAMALAKAQHEAVPFVRDYFSEIDRQFLVMELVEGDDLAVMLNDRQGPFPLSDCLRWMDQLLDALDYLHTLEPPIIHRDIKPQNLKLSRRGRIKLLDFGIAKSMGSGTLTLTGQTFIGATLDYSPVEQILRAIDPTFREYILLKHRDKAQIVLAQSTDARCDIFSAGATFYHLLTGQAPEDAVKRMLEIWEGRPDPLANPSILNVAIPPAVSAILLRALAVDRDERYSTASEMQAALHEVIAKDRFLESRVYNDSWRDRRLPADSLESKSPEERRLMQAQTERLNTGDVVAGYVENKTAPDIERLPTEPIVSVPAEPAAPADTGDTPAAGTFTGHTTDISQTELPAEAQPIENRKTVAFEVQRVTPARPPVRRTTIVYWIMPALLAGLLVITGFGGVVYWIVNFDGGRRRVEITNVNFTPSPTPLPTRPVAATPSPTADPMPVRTPKPSPTPTPKPTVERTPVPSPTPIRTPHPTPVRTPVVHPTPRRTPDPNCIYNNSCGKEKY